MYSMYLPMCFCLVFQVDYSNTFLPLVSAPEVGKLYVSNVTSASFSLSWNGTEGNVEGFVLEIIDSSWQREPAEYNLSSTAVSYDVTGLRPSTDYIAFLSGVVKGKRAHTISAFATTGNWRPPLSLQSVISLHALEVRGA